MWLREKNRRDLEELQAPLLDDMNFLEGIIETFCQRLLEEEITHHPQARACQRTGTGCRSLTTLVRLIFLAKKTKEKNGCLQKEEKSGR